MPGLPSADEVFGRLQVRQDVWSVTDIQREKCTCYYVSEHVGVDADQYAAEHLEEVRTGSVYWLVEYRCPRYGKRWLRDQPWGDAHGGGPGRLRTFEKVCRDLRGELGAVTALLPDDADAEAAMVLIRDRLGDCTELTAQIDRGT